MERVKIKIKPSFYVFIVAAVVFRQGYFAATYAIAVLLHELSHYLVASKLFYHCNEIQLSIFGAVSGQDCVGRSDVQSYTVRYLLGIVVDSSRNVLLYGRFLFCKYKYGTCQYASVLSVGRRTGAYRIVGKKVG